MGIGHNTLPNPQVVQPGIASWLVFPANLSGMFEPSRDWGPTTMASLDHKNLPAALRKNTHQHYSTDCKWQHFLPLLSFLRVQEWCVNCLKWPEQRKPALFSLMKLMLLEVCHQFLCIKKDRISAEELLKSVTNKAGDYYISFTRFASPHEPHQSNYFEFAQNLSTFKGILPT